MSHTWICVCLYFVFQHLAVPRMRRARAEAGQKRCVSLSCLVKCFIKSWEVCGKFEACATTGWPPEVSPGRRESPVSNHTRPPAPERPDPWPIRRHVADSERTATTDKMFDFHPSSHPSQDRSNLRVHKTPTSARVDRWIPVASEGFSFFFPHATCCLRKRRRLRPQAAWRRKRLSNYIKKSFVELKGDARKISVEFLPTDLTESVRSHDSACRRFTEDDETGSSPELPAGRLLSGR